VHSARHAPPEGTIRLHRAFPSRILGNRRGLAVWLPPGCDGRRRRHPVVYFQDGQNIFDPRTAFNGSAWNAGRAASRLIADGEIDPPIMVGIYNAGPGRMDEYAPTRGTFQGWDGKECRSRGLARSYARFVAAEVKPFIDARYPTLSGPGHTFVAGSSMGAIASLYAALWHPRVFGGAGLLSPSAWWDGLEPVRFVGALRGKSPVRIWLDTGTAEPGWENTRLLRDALLARGWIEDGDLRYHEAKDEGHHEDAWAARVGPMLRWLLGTGRPAGRKTRR